jgi:hypothetical protein
MPVLNKTWLEVGCRGDLVILTMGNLQFAIEFPLALRIATAMKWQARIAKLHSGRDDRAFHVLGMLHDATPGQARRLRKRDRLPELLRPHGLDISTSGQLVVFKIGKATAQLPFDVANTLSQWIRVRGKEAKRNAGELAHWSRFAESAIASESGRTGLDS